MTALTEGQRLGPYRIVRLLGEGGMGAVYEARQETLDRRVALKTLHSEYARHKDAVSRFFNEAKILSKLEHPSIVQVSDFGTAEDGTAYLVMEFLRGQSLGRRLATAPGHLPPVTALQIAWQVADVLAVAHAQGVVHRDLKPDNLMLVADPVAPGGERVKVLDFGIAKLTDPLEAGGLKTDSLAIMGTPRYMSPEQCKGAGGVDAKTDVYSLGCVLYHMLAGQPPFVAEGAGQIIGMHLFQTPAPLGTLNPRLPPQVTELVHRLLTKEKQARPSMSGAADDIGRLLASMPGSAPVVRSRAVGNTDPDATKAIPYAVLPSTLGHSTGQSSERTRKRTRLAVVVLAVLSASGLLLWKSRPAPAPLASSVSVVPAADHPSQPQRLSTALAPEQEGITPVPTIHWTLNTQPSGAAVVDDRGRLIGTTPWSEERAASPGMATLRLRKEGFAEAEVKLNRAADVSETVRLSKGPAAPAKPKPALPPGVMPPKPPKRPTPVAKGLPYEP